MVGGGWQWLAVGGWWRLVVVGGGWWLVIGGWWRLAVVGGWRLVAASGWLLVAVGGWRLAVGGWWSLGAVPKGGLNKKKKSSSLRTPRTVHRQSKEYGTHSAGCAGLRSQTHRIAGSATQ